MPTKLRRVKRLWGAAEHNRRRYTNCKVGLGGHPVHLPDYKEYAANGHSVERCAAKGATWWANHYGYCVLPGEDIHAAKADVMIILGDGNFAFTAEFEPDTPEFWQLPEIYRQPVIHVGRPDYERAQAPPRVKHDPPRTTAPTPIRRRRRVQQAGD